MTAPHPSPAPTLAALLARHAEQIPDAPAFTADGVTTTYGGLSTAARGLAAELVRRGLEPGDRVAVVARNGLPFVAAHFAASLAGVTLVGVNWRLSAHEVGVILDDADPRLVLADSEWAPLVGEARADRAVELLDGPDSSFGSWTAGPDDGLVDRSAPDRVLLMLYTTGTTGRAKGAMITETNVNEMVAEVSKQWRMRQDMRFVNVLPLFHVSGTGATFSTMFVGGEVIQPVDASAGAVAGVVQERGVTHAAFVPTTLGAIVNDPNLRDFDLSTLEVVIYGAAPSGGSVVQDAMALMPTCGFTQGYGLTETTGGVAVAPHRRHGEVDDRPGTVGRPCSKYEVRISDPVTGQELPAGTDGEVWLRGPQNAAGYWGRAEETAASFLPDGWFRTGDIGVVDDDGFLYLKDRLKDMIITGGENVYSVEVEGALLAHPDVLEVAVYGVSDATWGETVKAVVVRRAGSDLDVDGLLEHARGRLARYKCPRVVEFTDELPKAVSGKILKHELRQRDTAPA